MCYKQDTIYENKNSNIKEGIIYPNLVKLQVITMSNTVVDDNYTLSKHSETSMSVTLDK